MMQEHTGHIRRDEEAVSAVIGTVLLFAGVVSIIGVMMVTMIPVISDLEGAVEHGGMSGQFEKYSFETIRLSESGMPGDRVGIELDPLEGKLGWDQQNGGMWMSATWQEGQSFRMRSILDLDDNVEIRYPSGEVGSVCWDDMRLGPERVEITRVSDYSGKLYITPTLGLTQQLGTIQLDINQGTSKINSQIIGIEGVVIDLPLPGGTGDAWISSSSPVNVLFMRGDGGVTVFPPITANPQTGEGQNWFVPLPSGDVELHLVGENGFKVDWQHDSASGSEISLSAGGFFEEGAAWSKTITSSEEGFIQISTTTPARLLMIVGDQGAGSTPWPSQTGSSKGIKFLPPSLPGDLLIDNPSEKAVVIRTLGGSLSVSANSTLRMSWPPIGSSGSNWLNADEPVQINWLPKSNNTNSDRSGSMYFIGASDTGRLSGHLFEFTPATENGGISSTSYDIYPAGPSASFYISNWNVSNDLMQPTKANVLALDTNMTSIQFNESHNPGRVLSITGSNGLVVIPHEGFERCLALNVQASGWIKTTLPWDDVSRTGANQIEAAWKNGNYPSSLRVRIFATLDSNPSTPLATGWAFHMPRLTYNFDSSISGLELATSGGSVVTNYPQVQPNAIRGPSDRSGPGPRFSATIPLAFPIGEQIGGSGAVDVDLTLVSRDQLTSSVAYEVRRGWAGPYGGVIASWSSQDLTHSADWTTFPQQLQMLNDYKGWVPTPTPNSPETVYHTQGEPIQFSLQVSILSHEAHEVSG